MLGENQIKNYFDDGYLILNNFLDKETLDDLKLTANQMIEDFKKDKEIFIRDKKRNISQHGKMFLGNRYEDYPKLEKFTKGKFIKSLCNNILGDTIYLFNEQIVNKEPNTQSTFAWHQDSGYVEHEHKAYLSVWIALCDITKDNGALRISPINLNDSQEIKDHTWSETTSELSIEVDEQSTISCELNEGDAVLFSSKTPHASYSNLSDKNRPAYLCQYSSEPIIPPEGSNKKFRSELI